MLLRFLLLPFAGLYALITHLRNWAYQKAWLKSTSFDIPLINVGNLRVGGTGKTPHIEYLIRLFGQQYRLATLSRGYGRHSRGFVLAEDTSTVEALGDEPMQFFLKFSPHIQVAVCEDRVEGVRRLRALYPDLQLLLLDDAFQHRAVRAKVNILLTDYRRPFYKDWPLPAGRLRETAAGARRADMVIVSKCPPELSMEARTHIKEQIGKYLRQGVEVYFSMIRYAAPRRYDQHPSDRHNLHKCLVVSGIAQPQQLEKDLQQHYQVLRHFIFRDHHHYRPQEITRIEQYYKSLEDEEVVILTTEKDFVKLQALLSPAQKAYWYYLPIEIDFIGESIEADLRRLLER